MTNDTKALSDQIVNVRLDIRELNTKMDGIKDLTKKVEEVHDTAKEALASTKSAHKRIDELGPVSTLVIQNEKETDRANKRLDFYDKLAFWFGTSILGSVILGGLGLWKTYKP
ncbi:hypothetical protein ACVNS2_08075 [Paenibacillus caseinilyticus]|uniref:Uncharacterized protein n=1 Tax=Paenibacillus mucilaginosus K02 TaxID=997761 RepID=I0BE23_9BACL|nr:hypothetical protein [Paenibacillus mucilaginosus]AFH60620.1 hypothetical protein B2K_07780 [Paenibacillus mucilaginosus K02]